MEEQNNKKTEAQNPLPGGAKTGSGRPKSFGTGPAHRNDRGPRGRGGKGGEKRGGGRGRPERVKPEYDQKSIDVRRVARVVAGGRRFSFSVAMIIGDRKGKVGVGTGKAADISMAMDKAAKDAKKHMITVKLTKSNSLPHRVIAKSSSAIVEIIPAPSRGLVAGSSVRNALELAGITDVNAKIRSGSKNRLNMARATVKALSSLRPKAGVGEKAVVAGEK